MSVFVDVVRLIKVKSFRVMFRNTNAEDDDNNVHFTRFCPRACVCLRVVYV